MYMEKQIQETMRIFREMSCSELIKDDEVKQFKKITEILESLNNRENKMTKILDNLNGTDKDRGIILDDLYKEILELRDIVADKYIRIGICLERVE